MSGKEILQWEHQGCLGAFSHESNIPLIWRAAVRCLLVIPFLLLCLHIFFPSYLSLVVWHWMSIHFCLPPFVRLPSSLSKVTLSLRGVDHYQRMSASTVLLNFFQMIGLNWSSTPKIHSLDQQKTCNKFNTNSCYYRYLWTLWIYSDQH